MSTSSPAQSSPKTSHPETSQPQSDTPIASSVAPDNVHNSQETKPDHKEEVPAAPTPEPAAPEKDENGEHLLETPWTFWYDHKMSKSPTSAQNYAEHLRKLGTFKTIEGFYRMYANLLRPADLPRDSNYHLFRGEVLPMWESFPNGGCWILKVRRKGEVSLGLLWEQLLFAAIGEAFEEPKIVGVVLSTRNKADVLAVWSSDGQNHHIVHRMSDKLRVILSLDRAIPVEYKSHLTSMKDKSTYRNSKLVSTDKKKKKKGKGKKKESDSTETKQENDASATQEKGESSQPAVSNGGVKE